MLAGSLFFSGHSVNFLPQTSPKCWDVPKIWGRPLGRGYLCEVMNTNWGVGSFVNKTCRHQLSWITVTSYDVMKRLFSRIHYESKASHGQYLPVERHHCATKMNHFVWCVMTRHRASLMTSCRKWIVLECSFTNIWWSEIWMGLWGGGGGMFE